MLLRTEHQPCAPHGARAARGGAGCRGGPRTSDHVDVLGNHELMDVLLHVAAGRGDEVPLSSPSPYLLLASTRSRSGELARATCLT